MADTTPPAPPAAGKPPPSPLAGLAIPGLLILAAGVVFGVFYYLNPKSPPPDTGKMLDGYAVAAEKYAKLADGYADANGDLIADTPADAKMPTELFFCEIPGPNPEADAQTWDAFLKHMSAATGLPCKYLTKADVPAGPPEKREGDREEQGAAGSDGSVKSFDAQLAALKGGQLHVTAFTTGQVRQAVTTAGFRPLVVPADKDGKFFYQVKVLVPANSSAKTPADLKGKKLAVSALSSNSGAKAPLVMLHDEFKLSPRTDYSITLAGTHWAALAQVVGGKADATCIASDLLAREVGREPTEQEAKLGRVKLTEDQFKVIHTSGDFPKLCFGVSHALPEDLVAKIRKGFETFPFDGEVGKKYKADGAVKFQPVDYKKDWEAVRQVDDKLAEIVKKK